MPHLTIQVAPNGPIVSVYVGVSAQRKTALEKAGTPVPAPVLANLLVDTGASGTAIDQAILAQLNLSPTGVMTAHTPSTQQGAPAQLDQYDVSLNLVIPHQNITRTFHALPVGAAQFKHQGHDGLLGRDCLAHCLFIYAGPDNAFMLSI